MSTTELQAMIDAGARLPALAAAMRCHKNTARRRLAALAAAGAIRWTSTDGRPPKAVDVAAVRKARAAGSSITSIATMLGTTTWQVRKALA